MIEQRLDEIIKLLGELEDQGLENSEEYKNLLDQHKTLTNFLKGQTVDETYYYPGSDCQDAL